MCEFEVCVDEVLLLKFVMLVLAAMMMLLVFV